MKKPRTTYTVHAKKNGKPIASLHKVHDNLKAAKQDAAALAGMVPGATGVVVRKNAGKRIVDTRGDVNWYDTYSSVRVASLGHVVPEGSSVASRIMADGTRMILWSHDPSAADGEPPARLIRWVAVSPAEWRAMDTSFTHAELDQSRPRRSEWKPHISGTMTGKRAKRNPANVDMEKLGYQHAMETNAEDRRDAWAGLTAAQAREWIDGAAEADEIDYPVDRASIAAYRKGIKRALAGTAKRNPANPPREIVYGHVVVHTKAGYTIPAYKRTFPKMADARKWLKGHVQRESAPAANPAACRCRKK